MKVINKELEILKKYIANSFKEPLLNNEISDFMLGPSKRIRSCLALLYIKSQGIEVTDEIYRILAAGEILHNASLLHDDVIDDSEKRRGNITIAKKYSPKLAILAGDYLLALCFELLAKMKESIIESFKDCAKKMVQAEIIQYTNRGKYISSNDYIETCKNKTASLFTTILQCTAIVSNSDSTKAKIFAEKFGIVFQIKNDLEDTSAENDKKNKIFTANDILGIEKTAQLLDNYKEEMLLLLKDVPNNTYKKTLKDLIINLCTIERS
ncbi:MAG: hypothetical protein E7Z92_03120 [Cyanobacteria bacterium SIG31]|nr:hypothetical protein [Cyanobacteria bacterium SIG31]